MLVWEKCNLNFKGKSLESCVFVEESLGCRKRLQMKSWRVQQPRDCFRNTLTGVLFLQGWTWFVVFKDR